MIIATENTTNFQESIRRQGVTLVDFGTPWCPPCRVLLPILDELDQEFGDRLSILKVNCDELPMVAAQYGVMANPTVLLFHNGEPVEKLVGLRPKAAYQLLIERYL